MRARRSLIFASLVLLMSWSGCAASESTEGVDVRDVGAEAEASGADTVIETGPLGQPRDGRLYAAAAAAVITPTAEHHPCPLLLGGTGMNRLAEGVHDDLEARLLVLTQDDERVVIASLDLVGWLANDVDQVKAALAAQDIPADRVIVSSTHTHNGPDTIGVWGPSDGVTGRCPEYAGFLVQTLDDLVREAIARLAPVTVTAAETKLSFPESNFPNLVNDWRAPFVTNDRLLVARLDGEDGQTVASLINWHTHPEAMIHTKLISADLARWARARMEQEIGGVAVYLSGTIGGLQTIMSVYVPARTEAGEPIMEDGAPVWIEEDGPEKTVAAGHLAAEAALRALRDDGRSVDAALRIDVERLEIPFENPMMILAYGMGVLPPYDGFITDDPDRCGSFGCLPIDLHHVQLGDLHLVTLPGELFPETSVGRPETSHDYGSNEDGDWGVTTYPAITGYRDALPAGHLMMELGLVNHEIGYILPESDFHWSDHPGYYEEYFCVSKQAEAIIREGMTRLLSRTSK